MENEYLNWRLIEGSVPALGLMRGAPELLVCSQACAAIIMVCLHHSQWNPVSPGPS